MVDVCYDTEKFLSFTFYEGFPLVVTNLFLLLPVIKAYYLHEYVRAYLYFGSFLFSSLFHLCKIALSPGSACVLPLCSLKLLDYTFSYTILLSSILYFLDFGAVYKHYSYYHKHSKKHETNINKKNNFWAYEQLPQYGVFLPKKSSDKWKLKNKEYLVQADSSYIETWLIISCAIYVAINVSQNSFSSLTYTQLGIAIGILFFIDICGWIYNYLEYKIYPSYDVGDLLRALFFALLGIVLFVIADFIPVSLYWITHSPWHIFGSLSQVYLLEARNFRKSGWFVCCFDRINEY